MAAYRNNNTDKISKSVVNIIDITMNVFHSCGCKILYCTVDICMGIYIISCEISIPYHINILLYQWITNFVPYHYHSMTDCTLILCTYYCMLQSIL